MSLFTVDNGQMIVVPGAYSNIAAQDLLAASLPAAGIVALVGEADGGAPGLTIVTDPNVASQVFVSGDLCDAMRLAFSPANDPDVNGGASMVLAYKVNQSLQSALSLGSVALTSVQYGDDTNHIGVSVAAGANGGRIVTFAIDSVTKISPELGIAPVITITYTGDATTAVLSVTNAGMLTTTLAGQTDTSANLNISLATYATVKRLADFINAQVGYSCVINGTSLSQATSDLDYVTGVNIKAAPAVLLAGCMEFVNWVNNVSGIATAVRAVGAPGSIIPPVSAKQFMSGGARGISSNLNFQNAFDALAKVRCNLVVPLISQDNLGGGTALQATIAAQLLDHLITSSGEKGKSERQGFFGFGGNKAAVKAQAQASNSPYLALCSQKVTALDAVGNLVQHPEWALAVICAGVKAGAGVGGSLTYKAINVADITQDASWNPFDNADEMILAGVLIARKDQVGGAIRIVKGNTSYTAEDNDAYTSIEVWESLLFTSYGLRTFLEQRYTGKRKSVHTASDYKVSAKEYLDTLVDDGVIISYDPSLIQISVARDVVKISVKVEPAQGINYTLLTVFAVQNTQTA